MPRPTAYTHSLSIASNPEAPCTPMAGTVIQGWRKKALNGRSRSWGVATETTPRDYCRASTESPHYSNAGCWEPTKVRWQASTCRTTWMNSRFGSIAGDPRAVASSSSGLCSKRSVRLPLPTKPWSNRQSQPSTYWGKLSQGDTHFLVFFGHAVPGGVKRRFSRLELHVDCASGPPPAIHLRRRVPDACTPRRLGHRPHADRHPPRYQPPHRQCHLDLHRHFGRRHGQAHRHRQRARLNHGGERHRTHGVAVRKRHQHNAPVFPPGRTPP